MTQVIYDSRGGNTRKLAEAIAEELSASVADAEAATLGPDTGVLFLGSGCYADRPGKNMVRFIEANDFRDRKVALFGTSGGGEGNEVRAMADALKARGADVVGSYFCAGQVALLFSHGHPNAADIGAARKFARTMSGSQ